MAGVVPAASGGTLSLREVCLARPPITFTFSKRKNRGIIPTYWLILTSQNGNFQRVCPRFPCVASERALKIDLSSANFTAKSYGQMSPFKMSPFKMSPFVKQSVGVPKPGCFKPGCLQFLRGSALRRSFAPFWALLRTCICAPLRSFVLICVFLRPTAFRTTAFRNFRNQE